LFCGAMRQRVAPPSPSLTASTPASTLAPDCDGEDRSSEDRSSVESCEGETLVSRLLLLVLAGALGCLVFLRFSTGTQSFRPEGALREPVYDLLIAVSSRRASFDARCAARASWLKYFEPGAAAASCGGLCQRTSVGHFFALGLATAVDYPDLEPEPPGLLQALAEEQQQHGDLALLRNWVEPPSSLKTAADRLKEGDAGLVFHLLRYAMSYFNFSLMLRMDDEAYLFGDRLLFRLNSSGALTTRSDHSESVVAPPAGNFYIGSFAGGLGRKVDLPATAADKEKSDIAFYKTTALDVYPEHAHGPVFLLSAQLVRQIVFAPVELRRFKFEDATIGAWVMATNHTKVDIPIAALEGGCEVPPETTPSVGPSADAPKTTKPKSVIPSQFSGAVFDRPDAPDVMRRRWHRYLALADPCADPGVTAFHVADAVCPSPHSVFRSTPPRLDTSQTDEEEPVCVSPNVTWKGYDWRVGHWGECHGSCKNRALQHRCVSCLGGDGKAYDFWRCPLGHPSSSRPCPSCSHSAVEAAGDFDANGTNRSGAAEKEEQLFEEDLACRRSVQQVGGDISDIYQTQPAPGLSRALAIARTMLDIVGVPFIVDPWVVARWEESCTLPLVSELPLLVLHRHIGPLSLQLLEGLAPKHGLRVIFSVRWSPMFVGYLLALSCGKDACGGEGRTFIQLRVAEETPTGIWWPEWRFGGDSGTHKVGEQRVTMARCHSERPLGFQVFSPAEGGQYLAGRWLNQTALHCSEDFDGLRTDMMVFRTAWDGQDQVMELYQRRIAPTSQQGSPQPMAGLALSAARASLEVPATSVFTHLCAASTGGAAAAGSSSRSSSEPRQTNSDDGAQPPLAREAYVLDNGALQAGASGLAFRRSMMLDDKVDDYATWGDTVHGEVVEDPTFQKWLKVGLERYLPFTVGTATVLLPPKTTAEEWSMVQAGTGFLCAPDRSETYVLYRGPDAPGVCRRNCMDMPECLSYTTYEQSNCDSACVLTKSDCQTTTATTCNGVVTAYQKGPKEVSSSAATGSASGSASGPEPPTAKSARDLLTKVLADVDEELSHGQLDEKRVNELLKQMKDLNTFTLLPTAITDQPAEVAGELGGANDAKTDLSGREAARRRGSSTVVDENSVVPAVEHAEHAAKSMETKLMDSELMGEQIGNWGDQVDGDRQNLEQAFASFKSESVRRRARRSGAHAANVAGQEDTVEASGAIPLEEQGSALNVPREPSLRPIDDKDSSHSDGAPQSISHGDDRGSVSSTIPRIVSSRDSSREEGQGLRTGNDHFAKLDQAQDASLGAEAHSFDQVAPVNLETAGGSNGFGETGTRKPKGSGNDVVTKVSHPTGRISSNQDVTREIHGKNLLRAVLGDESIHMGDQVPNSDRLTTRERSQKSHEHNSPAGTHKGSVHTGKKSGTGASSNSKASTAGGKAVASPS